MDMDLSFEAVSHKKSASKKKEATVEDTYKKMSQLEHVLARPDTYVGSVEPMTNEEFVYDPATRLVELQEVEYVPALFKIFDEILVNAADNRQRSPDMDTLKVAFNEEDECISVWNNGKGIPVVMHKVHHCYVPELIFGHLLTSSNYDDTEARTTGGRNGYGSKLTNILSKKFVVETVDGELGLKYRQVWRKNMTQKEEPVITSVDKGASSYTKVTFWPDFTRFKGMKSLKDTDILAMMRRRVVDIAGCAQYTPATSKKAKASASSKKDEEKEAPKKKKETVKRKELSVYLNGEKIKMKSFQDYVKMYLRSPNCGVAPAADDGKDIKEKEGMSSDDEDEVKVPLPPFVYEKVNDNWELAVCVSASGAPQQVSFVNSIHTSQGGSHVDYLTDQIAKHVSEHILKKHKTTVKITTIKNHLFLFANTLIVNPVFETQTKVKLKMNRTQFGSKCELSDTFLANLLKKTSLIEDVMAAAAFQDAKSLKKQDGKKSRRITGLPKLEDANEAGGKLSRECTLILTEGDSAKALAVSGLSIIGRDKNGVFPLRGKLLNVRECQRSKAILNAEIAALIKILGLQHGRKYDSVKDLRYGHVMIMTDQDHDGSHIKGLLINMFSAWWPELLQIKGFLQEFITPIVKVKKGGEHNKKGKCITFFTLPEFEAWYKQPHHQTGWSIKYYKGLGTSTSGEAKEYFSALDIHQLDFRYVNIECDKAIQMAFAKNQVAQRKQWLETYVAGLFLDQSKGFLTYQDFIHKELILFSVASNMRAIPSVVDGLKPGQRKILYVCFKRNLTKEIKVAQLAGSVAEKSAYHHGEASLNGTIVGMAQNFVGSNNIHLLYPSGQFGTRLNGGTDAASPRYIFTRLMRMSRVLYHPADDALLRYLDDDGQTVEPEYYIPILPMVLVNGSAGIGTGWASKVPNYNPRDLVKAIRALLHGKPVPELHPWYRGFTGTIVPSKPQQYMAIGRLERINATTLRVAELPFRWTTDYKLFLEKLMSLKQITEIREHHTEAIVSFTIRCTEEQMAKLEKKGLYTALRLTKSINTSNMVLFNAKGQLRKYLSPLEILQEFYTLRVDFYERRKAHLLKILQEECEVLKNRVRYIQAVRKGEIVLKESTDVLLKKLVEGNYKAIRKVQKKETKEGESVDEPVEEEEEEDEKEEGKPRLSDYHYLVHQTQLSLTKENAERLTREYKTKEEELERVRQTTPLAMYEKDLDKFEEELKIFEQEEEEELKKGPKESPKRKKTQTDKEKEEKKTKSKTTKAPTTLVVGTLIPPPPILYTLPKKAKEMIPAGHPSSLASMDEKGSDEEEEEEDEKEEEEEQVVEMKQVHPRPVVAVPKKKTYISTGPYMDFSSLSSKDKKTLMAQKVPTPSAKVKEVSHVGPSNTKTAPPKSKKLKEQPPAEMRQVKKDEVVVSSDEDEEEKEEDPIEDEEEEVEEEEAEEESSKEEEDEIESDWSLTKKPDEEDEDMLEEEEDEDDEEEA